MTDSSEHTDLSSHFSLIESPPHSIRSVEIIFGGLQCQLDIPRSLHFYVTRSRDHFLSSLSNAESNNGEPKPESLPELISRFLLFIIQHEELGIYTSAAAHAQCIDLLLQKLEFDFLRGTDVHTVASRLPGNAWQRQTVVKAYFAAITSGGDPRLLVPHESVLFNQSSRERPVKLYAVFGGQGLTTDYFSELRALHSTYPGFVGPLVATASLTLHSLLSAATTARLRHFSQGLDVRQWLQRPELTPEPEYLLSAPVSFPLIGLFQLANFAVMCRVLGKPPGQLVDRFLGMAGHSQGVVNAAAVATATTWESFDVVIRKALTILFHISTAAQQATQQGAVPSNLSVESMNSNEGFPTPMLNVAGCPQSLLQEAIDRINHHLEPEHYVAIGLVNGPTNMVVSGPILSLCALTANLRRLKPVQGLEQDKVPYSLRKPEFTIRFLPISCPFHTPHLEAAVAVATKELEHIQIKPSDLQTAVYHSRTGEDLRASELDDVVPELVRMILTEPDNWPVSTQFPSATHVLDFGPGILSGVGGLLHRNKEGSGVRVILVSALEGTSTELGYRSEIFERDAQARKWGDNWDASYAPRLVKAQDGSLQIDNAMTRLLGLPPLMVAGMTPTTVSWEFVSAIVNAGYHVELAGGGYFEATEMTAAIKNLQQAIPPGKGICINIIYANPRQVQWQIPLIQKLLSEGAPIDGLTFGAGVPSIDVAQQYIDTLNLRYLCFKPGSASAISQVIAIAHANRDFKIVLQWTGGRGGGHHSYEDFHDPILKLYGKIRRSSNIVLVAGSGFGGAQDTYRYLSGSWSVAFGFPPMPFDGCLFGSRMMVAKEAKTSPGAKAAIIAAPGLDDAMAWEQSYNRPAGGIITVRSEMGEPIHKLATRGVLLWREMDDKIFSIQDKPKRLEALRKLKPYIVQRLNEDFQKVWFGRDVQGNVVDLEDMTYAEVFTRLIELLYVRSQSRWIDPSYQKLTVDFVRRMLSRLCDSVAQFEVDFGLQDPESAAPKILQSCPLAEKQIITFHDARYFVLLCKRQGQKPPTFVPDLDDDFEFWFKKDSLWQSEDLEAVVDHDAQRTCILHGPVAAKYSIIADEPVKHILGNIHKAHIAQVLQDRYHGNVANVPVTGTRSIHSVRDGRTLPHCHIIWAADKAQYRIDGTIDDNQLPTLDQWLELLAGGSGTWLHALLTTKDVIQGSKVVANPIRRTLSPTQGMHIDVSTPNDPEQIVVAIAESGVEMAIPTLTKYSVVIRKQDSILVTFYTDETVEKVTLPLTFRFTYHPDLVLHPIHEVVEGRNDRLRQFYYRLWFGSGLQPALPPFPIRKQIWSFDSPLQTVARAGQGRVLPSSQTTFAPVPQSRLKLEKPAGLHATLFKLSSLSTLRIKGSPILVSSPSIQEFCDSIEQSSKIISARPNKSMASLDFAIVVGWEVMMKAIFPEAIEGEFLNLVHLSNKFKLLNNSAPLSSFDLIESTAEIVAIKNEPAGRVVTVAASIERDNKPVMELTSEFLFRGTYTDSSVCFEKKAEAQMSVELDTQSEVAILKSKPWFHLLDAAADILGLKLVFELHSLTQIGSAKGYRGIHTFGQVFYSPAVEKAKKLVATVDFQAGQSTSNPVLEYLRRHGSSCEPTHSQENPQPLGEQDCMRITMPVSNQVYARASGDYNPIHVSRPFAKYADLPGTITHGMYTSAAVRQLVEKAAGCSEEVRMRSYTADFVGMVLPGESLEVHVSHVAMRRGLRVLSFHAVNVHTGGRVLVGEAEVDQALTAYVFAGQGSQRPGMGMDLYATSAVARDLWDRADKFFSETFGFLIRDIVIRNPTELTVHFGGRRGHQIRQNYIDMTVESGAKAERFFQAIDETSSSHTFRHRQGLLFSTEFAQPALTIMERAQFLHLKSRGLIPEAALFAGHSLGEYSALSTIGEIMPFEKLLTIVFYRGLSMQSAVERDPTAGHSRFSMVAVNPSRVGRFLNTPALQNMVAAIAGATGDLLEVVNYNVEGQQYVCAGSLQALDCLAAVTTRIAGSPGEFTGSSSEPDKLDEAKVLGLIQTCAAETLEKSTRAAPIVLTRGAATIPLEGIDVPFHSSYLLAKMPAFRKTLMRHIPVAAIDPQRLVGKYVSNVVGKTFDISHETVREVYVKTQSVVLKDLLEEMERSAF